MLAQILSINTPARLALNLIRMKHSTSLEPGECSTKRSAPKCAIAFVLVPMLVGGLAGLAVASTQVGDSGSLGTYILVAYALVASLFAGMLLAIAAVVRRERWLALPCISLAFNASGLAFLLKFLL